MALFELVTGEVADDVAVDGGTVVEVAVRDDLVIVVCVEVGLLRGVLEGFFVERA